MIRLYIAAILLFVVSISSQTFENLEQSPKQFKTIQKIFQDELIGNQSLDSIKGWKQFKRWEWFWGQRLYGQTELPNALEIKNTAESYSKKTDDKLSQIQSVTWEKYGPFETPSGSGGNTKGIGRVNDLAISPVSNLVMIAGSASGGAWRTTNAGQQWIEIDMTDQLSLGISDVEFAPTDANIVYLATGDANGTLGSNADYYSVGLLKSTDGGVTFETTSIYYELRESKVVTRVLIHPQNPNIVLVSSSDGIFRSKDGAVTWDRVFSTTTIKDMEFHPTNPDIIYSATMSRGGSNSVYKSTNNGLTWRQIKLVGNARRTEIAVTNAAPDNLYLISAGQSRQFNTFEVSEDKGENWQTRATQASAGNLLGWRDGDDLNKGQGSYDLSIAVNPTDKNDIYIGGVNIWHSINGGSNWNLYTHWSGGYERPGVHADQHQLIFSPNGDYLYVGNDGGVYRNNSGTSMWEDLNNGMDITQYYRLGVSQSAAFNLVSGSQDNGTTKFDGIGWSKIRGADGMECAIDPTDSNRVYVSIYYGRLYRSTNGGDSFSKIMDSTTIQDFYGETEKGGWVTPYVINQSNPKYLFAGYNNVWMNNNYGDKTDWVKISDFGDNTSTNLVSLAVHDDNQHIYAGTNGLLRRTTDGGDNWENIHNSGNAITYVAINPLNPKQAYITKSGFGDNDKVLFYDGNEWKDLSGNLPSIPVNTIVIEDPVKQSIYIGTDIGVFYSDLNSGFWKKLEGEIPNTIVNELEIHRSSGKLYAATYGRGIWRTDLLGCNSDKLELAITGDLEFCEGDSVILESVIDLPNYKWNTGETTKSIVVKESGNYVLTNSSDDYCVDKSEIVFVNVFDSSEDMISAGDGVAFCDGVTKLRLGIPFTYQNVNWSTGETNKFINVTQPGEYTVSAVSSSGCVVNDTIVLYQSNLTNNIQITRTGSTLSVPEGFSYKWFLNDTLLPESNVNQIEITEPGIYRVEIEDDYGCSSDPEVVEVLTNVNQLDELTEVELYPNPVKNQLNLDIGKVNSQTIYFELFNSNGEMVFRNSFNSNNIHNLDMKNYSNGVYFAKITINDKKYFQKIVITK
jgi:photosystem II stability/assembly factor-like uncharacterized protein